MDQDVFNLDLRKFLKRFGVTAQREIEQAVADALKSGALKGEETDMFGHRKLGGIGDTVAGALKAYSPRHNNGRRIDVVNQRLGYLVRSGDPDGLDSIVPMAFGNLALDLILRRQFGRLVSIHKGFYRSVPITSVTSEKKVVDVAKYYNTARLRPIYEFDGAPLFIMTSD